MSAGYAVLVAAAARVAWVDWRRYRIEYESLAVAAVAGAMILCIEDGGGVFLWSASGAAVAMAFLGLLVRFHVVRRPGAGDWVLACVCLALAGRNLLLFAAVLSVTGLGVAAAYAWIRQRPFFRSRFPLAPPALFAALAAFLLPGGF